MPRTAALKSRSPRSPTPKVAKNFTRPYPPREQDDVRTGDAKLDAKFMGDPLSGLVLEAEALQPLRLVHRDDASGIWLYHGDCLEVLDALAVRYPEGRFDAIFADPPYFLSNGGITCHAGKMVRVDKGEWDKSKGPELNHEFNRAWLERCQRALKPNGTIWVTGTHHVIHSVGFAMQQLGFKILNDITWEKPNPPPNLSCRYFTHSTETVIWAAKNEKSKHRFNYPQMRQINGGKQMKSVWTMTAPKNDEKTHGKHPTQKPLALVERCLLASTNPGDLVLDPFLGGGTTAVAAMRIGRRCMGIEVEMDYIILAARRLPEVAPFRVRICISVTKQIDLDLFTELIDPSGKMAGELPADSCKRILHETKFVFLSCAQVESSNVVHTTIDVSVQNAWERAPLETRKATTHIVRCETEIFRIKQD